MGTQKFIEMNKNNICDHEEKHICLKVQLPHSDNFWESSLRQIMHLACLEKYEDCENTISRF